MLDNVTIEISGGSGGNGLVSFHREKFVPQGGPDGGDGGRGGRVYLRAVDDVYTLEQYRSRRKFRAGNGTHGGVNLRHGADGEDLYLDVPAGTVVLDGETGEILADLAVPGSESILAYGGRGGWGNKKFATSTNQAPFFSQKGHDGETVAIRLELRMLAEVGLLGLPNAGKSTLLAALSNAMPKIAAYPFTTLEPMLGVVNVGYDRFTLADLPGLIEGASEGYGLGFEFLQHIRRCRVLLHLIDCSSLDPVTDYELIQGEVRAYDPELASIPTVVAVSKADLEDATARHAAATLSAHIGADVAILSADEGIGLEALKATLLALVRSERTHAEEARQAIVPVLHPASAERFTISPDGQHRYVVDGRRIVTFIEMMDTQMEGSGDEVERRLTRWGINKALLRAGAVDGDVVVFGDVEWRYRG